MARFAARSFQGILLEVLLIIMGVLAGMWVNDWREEQNHKKEARRSLQLIHTEIEHNLEAVKSSLEKRRINLQGFQQLTGRFMQDPTYEFNIMEVQHAAPEGFSSPLIERSAWDLAHQTGNIQYMSLEVASKLSRLYSLQEFYQKKLDVLGLNGYVASNIDLDKLESTVLALTVLIKDTEIQEIRLSEEEYPEMLSYLDEIVLGAN